MSIPQITQARTDNITIQQGSDYAAPYKLVGASDVPIDLDGVTLEAKIRSDFGASATILATFTATITDSSEGKVLVELPRATTAALGVATEDKDPVRSVNIGFWDLELTHDGKTYRYIQGTVTISREATV